MLALLAAAALAAGGYDAGSQLCALQDEEISESSGVVAGARSDLVFTHNDSGDDARFFALDRQCRTVATYSLSGVEARDWEDVSRGPSGTLWFGDIGDNREARDRGILVHRVDEPRPGTTGQVAATSYRLRYEDGPHDAEALIVTPRSGRLIVVTKSLGTRAGVYAADASLRSGGSVNVLRRVGDVPVSLVTGGDISPDGSRVVLRNYSSAYLWDVVDGDVLAALEGEPIRVPLPPSERGEAITFDRDGRTLLVTSEGVGAPVSLLRPDGSPRTAAAPVEESAEDHPLPRLLLAVGLGALLLFFLRRRRRRR